MALNHLQRAQQKGELCTGAALERPLAVPAVCVCVCARVYGVCVSACVWTVCECVCVECVCVCVCVDCV